VTHGHHPDTAREIKELVPVDIHDNRIVGVGSIDGEGGGHSRRNDRQATLVELC